MARVPAQLGTGVRGKHQKLLHFCQYESSSLLTTVSWSENGLTGRYFTDERSETDGYENGYLIVHLLQDMPVNPNNGYIE